MLGRLTAVVADECAASRARRVAALAGAGWYLRGEAVDAAEARSLVRRLHPRVLVVAARLPGDALALVRDVRDAEIAECVVVDGRRVGCDAFAFAVAGAAGYVGEDEPDECVVAAVEQVVRGDAALPPHLVREILEDLRRRDHEEALHHCNALSTLTPRQWEVLDMMREGLSTQQMARRLVVEPVTVRSHVARILHVLRARDRVEALQKLDVLFAAAPRGHGTGGTARPSTALRYLNTVDGFQQLAAL